MVKFDHMSLPVTNVRKSRDWYVKNLGFKVEFERGGIAAIQDPAGFTIFLAKAQKSLPGIRSDRAGSAAHAASALRWTRLYQVRGREREMEAIKAAAERAQSGPLREGLNETLTVMGLHLPEGLERVLSSTNLIENLFSQVREIARRVKRWQGGSMILL
jgi:catechol 2,3-dioxygenase-like lactoylglutathione lyase family enzyme